MYDQIKQLVSKVESSSAGDGPTLEHYLSALWQVVSSERDQSLSAEQFLAWLMTAFEQQPASFREEWRAVTKGDIYLRDSYDDATFADWEQLILFQIADLRRMAEAGILENEYRYGGVDSPSGERWYNFDPAGYLECAAAGIFGRGEQESENENLPFLWGDFIGFLICGQIYE